MCAKDAKLKGKKIENFNVQTDCKEERRTLLDNARQCCKLEEINGDDSIVLTPLDKRRI